MSTFLEVNEQQSFLKLNSVIVYLKLLILLFYWGLDDVYFMFFEIY